MARQLKLTPIVDDSLALRSFQRMQGAASGFTGSLAGIGKKGTSFSGLASAMSASGLLGQFSELQGLLGNFSSGLDHLGGKRVNLGKVLGGVGIGAAALGGVGEQLSSPLEAAKAQLDQSIKNAGGNVAALAKPISDEQKRMQGLGFTYADTDSSLSKLTQGFGSGKKAISEEGLVADLAARNHTDLASSAVLVVKAYAKSPMVLKQFGINLADTTTKGKAAVSAQKAHTKAQGDLAKAQQHLSQLQARLGSSGAASDTRAAGKRQANAAAVVAAQDQLAAAGQHLQDVEARLREGHTSAAAAQSELESAQNRVAAAQTRLTTAQGKSVEVTGLSVSQQQELANAQGAVADAQKKVNLTGYVAATTAGDLNKANVTGQQILDMLTKKTHGLAQAQAQTFGGDLRKWKATVIDFGATWGAKFAKPLIAIGPALAGVGLLLESNFFGKIGRGITGLTRGVLGLPKAVGGLLGIVKPVPAAAEVPAGLRTSPGVPLPGEEGLSTAASALEQAAAALKAAAAQLQGAAGEESGAAGQLDASATGLDTAGGGLEAAGGGLSSSSAALDASGTSLDASGTALDASGTALDASGTALDASATALDGAAAASGAKGVAGGAAGGAISKAALVGTAGLLAYQGTSAVLKHNLFGAGTGVKHVLGALGIGAAPVTRAGVAKNIIGGQATLDALAKKDPRAAAILKGLPRAATGALVLARPGGTPLIAGEAGQNEIVGSPAMIVTALERALGVSGGAGRSGPDVAHYHHGVTIRGPITVHASDVNSLMRQLQAEARRANFAGHGPAGGSDL